MGYFRRWKYPLYAAVYDDKLGYLCKLQFINLVKENNVWIGSGDIFELTLAEYYVELVRLEKWGCQRRLNFGLVWNEPFYKVASNGMPKFNSFDTNGNKLWGTRAYNLIFRTPAGYLVYDKQHNKHTISCDDGLLAFSDNSLISTNEGTFVVNVPLFSARIKENILDTCKLMCSMPPYLVRRLVHRTNPTNLSDYTLDLGSIAFVKLPNYAPNGHDIYRSSMLKTAHLGDVQYSDISVRAEELYLPTDFALRSDIGLLPWDSIVHPSKYCLFFDECGSQAKIMGTIYCSFLAMNASYKLFGFDFDCDVLDLTSDVDYLDMCATNINIRKYACYSITNKWASGIFYFAPLTKIAMDILICGKVQYISQAPNSCMDSEILLQISNYGTTFERHDSIKKKKSECSHTLILRDITTTNSLSINFRYIGYICSHTRVSGTLNIVFQNCNIAKLNIDTNAYITECAFYNLNSVYNDLNVSNSISIIDINDLSEINVQ